MSAVILAVLLGAVAWQVAAQERDGDPAPETEHRMAQRPDMAEGAELYDRFCLACHGLHGDGKGPAEPWLWPRARDFTRGQYKWRTTPTGTPPTDADLAAAIVYGVPGTSMHGFGQTLTRDQITTLVEYLKTFAPDEFAPRRFARRYGWRARRVR